MLTKTELKKILAENDIRLRKKWGQSFLIDKNIKDKIIELADVKNDDFIVEIGPGLGALTEDLAKNAGRVVAVEKDRKLCVVLKNLLTSYKNTTVLESDILDFDFNQLNAKNIKVIGNLPYYITTPIVSRLFQFAACIRDILITVQKEVAQRMVAGPGSKNYGSFSLYVDYFTKPSIEMTIKKNAFFPQPEVDSCLVRFKMKSVLHVSIKNEKLLFEIIRVSFRQRRKTLQNTLKEIFSPIVIKTALDFTRIAPSRRPETLSLEDFINIANAIDNYA